MKLETILQKIEKIQAGTYTADELKEELKEAIRKETCYKTTKKSRVQAISRLFKKGNEYISYYKTKQTYNNQFIFTDSYKMYLLNEDLGYPETKSPITNINMFFDTDGCDKKDFILDFNDILTAYKLKTELYQINNINFSTSYLKDVIDVLGTDLQGFTVFDGKRLYLENSKGEKALLLGYNM